MVINIASHHGAYVLCLAAALAITAARGNANGPVLLVSVLFVAFSIAMTTGILLLSGRDVDRVAAKCQRFPAPRNALMFLKDADPHLTRNIPLLGQAVVWQMAIFVIDAATIWVLIQALGATASPWAVFASFMIASVFRTVGIVPGGLGIFEATSVWTRNMMDVAIPIGLAATLLFRGFSFWLPMLPGLWISRRIATSAVPASMRKRAPENYWSADAET